MVLQVAPTQSDALTALRTALLGFLPAGVEVIQGQDNRVPEPAGADFVVMTPILRPRLATNIDFYDDCAFTGSIAGTLLTATAVAFGALAVGMAVYDTAGAVAAGTQITAAGADPGTFVVSISQTVAAGPLFAGQQRALQATQLSVQLDVHGPASAENAQIISTLLRDPAGADAMAAVNPAIVPLYADDPKQIPFVNAEQQYENRWVITAVLETDQTVSGLPQQFADQLDATLIEVDAAYPAS